MTNGNDKKTRGTHPKERAPFRSKPASKTTQSATQQMEVHHHPQLDHNPKPWKEYLLEGFMIFIAVMMGFIAENIREYIDNKEHAKQLTMQLVQDMKTDAATLDTIYEGEAKILRANDSLINILEHSSEKTDVKKLQQFVANSHSLWPFHPSIGAINAIKNEVHLKQFANSKIIGYIARYEGHIELLRTVQDITLQYQRNFLDPFLYQHFSPQNLEAAFNHKPIPGGSTQRFTTENLTQLGAQMVLIRINTNELLINNRKLKDDAVAIVRYVTKQFGLEEEK